MIHHIHGDGFPKVNGSVSVDKIRGVIDKYPNCVLTFDDRLPSQELVLDLLREKGKRSYFFINHHNVMEQDRMIREGMGDKFYEWFFAEYEFKLPAVPDSFLSQFSFYTYHERLYRYIRDFYDADVHDSIMRPMRRQIELLDLDKIKDHEIGLHSYSHPTDMSKLTFEEQFDEYVRNLEMCPNAFSMSHPMGRYSKATLKILKALKIRIGFRSDNVAGETSLEKPRVDINNL